MSSETSAKLQEKLQTEEASSHGFVIAALGASAGGLEAFEKFFQHMPPNAGIAFIVVQHLAPDHATVLPDLLGKHTQMPVVQARDQTKVLPDHVYVIPPNATLTIEKGVLHVSPPKEARGHRMPIDSLFGTLAEDCGENAVCIMFSGTGTDGTSGLTAIKEFGGMAMAQTLESAKYDSILRSAISTGLVDHVLPIEEMAAKLVEYEKHLHANNGRPTDIAGELSTHLDKIHSLLKRQVGHDFSQYKENTIARRLSRRMNALQIDTVEKYVQTLEGEPEEAERLFKDLLIGVTHFFRDAEAFDALAQQVIPKLFDGKTFEDQVRVCVVGCATGEEAYSLAIMLSEYASSLQNPPAIKVFATDIDERGLETARHGRYPASIAAHVSPERLDRFFLEQDNAYQIRRELRELCIFTNHSFLKDPPLSRQDLISCRNVMIYLGVDLQQKIVPLFHYALRPGGFLFLGPSESASSHKDLFQIANKKYRIFRRRETVVRALPALPSLGDIGRPRPPGGSSPEADQNVPRQLERIILQRYRPACVTVKENGEAIYFSGPTGRYLQPAAGTPDHNVINMAREGLRIPLRTGLYKAVSTRESVVQHRISVEANGSSIQINLIVEPITELPSANLYMILFEEVDSSDRASPRQSFDADAQETIRGLEDELRSANEQAQVVFEELESSNEELKSANEEFQSTNEELESSKEEAQSINEELETVNSELNRRVVELDHANSDLQNLNNSTQIATIFLDRRLCIRNFTPAAGSVFHLIPGDIGRPIGDLAAQFIGEVDLVPEIEGVLATLTTCDRELAGLRGRHYLARVMPYRTVYNVIDGVVMTFTDVTQFKEVERRADAAKNYAESIVETVREPLLVLDGDLRVQSANAAFFKLFRVSANNTLGKFVYEIGDGQWDVPELQRLLSEILPAKNKLQDFRVQQHFPNVGELTLLLNAHQIVPQPGARALILLAMEDITARSLAEDSLREANRDLQHFAYAASHDLQEPLRMVTSYTQLLSREFTGRLGPKGDLFIGYCVQGALRMEMLLKGLRDYWAVNQERVEENVVADVNHALGEALANLDARIKECGGTITHDPLPSVRAEELPLVHLFQNLIGNALKYAQGGEPPRVHISVTRPDGHWQFSVRDRGIGIGPQYLKTIFIPFKRLPGTNQPGSGLGLAICQRIVERYKGRIWAQSTVGEGSTFLFTLPP